MLVQGLPSSCYIYYWINIPLTQRYPVFFFVCVYFEVSCKLNPKKTGLYWRLISLGGGWFSPPYDLGHLSPEFNQTWYTRSLPCNLQESVVEIMISFIIFNLCAINYANMQIFPENHIFLIFLLIFNFLFINFWLKIPYIFIYNCKWSNLSYLLSLLF